MDKIKNFTIFLAAFLFVSNTQADEKMYYPLLVTNLPCVLDISLHGTKIDAMGKTNAVIQFTVKTMDNKTYYLAGSPANSNLDMEIYSLNQDKKIDKLLFPKNMGFNFYSGGVTNDYSICFNKPYTNQILCPLAPLEEAKYGFVGKVGISEDPSSATQSSTNKNMYLYKGQRLYSSPFYLPKGNAPASSASVSPQ